MGSEILVKYNKREVGISVYKNLFTLLKIFCRKEGGEGKKSEMGGRLFGTSEYMTINLWKRMLKTTLKGSKQFHYYFIIFIFDMYYLFFIGSGSFTIVERGVYDSTPIVLKKLHYSA